MNATPIENATKAGIRYFFYGLGALYCAIVVGINLALLWLIGPLGYLLLVLILAVLCGFWFVVFKLIDWAFD